MALVPGIEGDERPWSFALNSVWIWAPMSPEENRARVLAPLGMTEKRGSSLEPGGAVQAPGGASQAPGGGGGASQEPGGGGGGGGAGGG